MFIFFLLILLMFFIIILICSITRQKRISKSVLYKIESINNYLNKYLKPIYGYDIQKYPSIIRLYYPFIKDVEEKALKGKVKEKHNVALNSVRKAIFKLPIYKEDDL